MKTTVAPYQHMALCLRIECTDGSYVRVTRHPVDLVMSNGAIYQTGSGFDFTAYEAQSGFSPSAIDLAGVLGFAGVTRDKVSSGVFDNARAYLFACDFMSPVEDFEPIVSSLLGRSELTDDGYRFEDMALIDALNQSTGKTYTPGCPKTFGGQEFAGCKVDLSTITVTGTLTHVSSQFVVRDSARSEAADWFGYGKIRFLTGANAGLKPQEIRTYAADGTVEVFEPFFYQPAIGDQYEMVPGCRKRLADCKDKWDNVVNFGGFPTIPTSSVYSSWGSK